EKVLEEPEDIFFVASAEHPCSKKAAATKNPLELDEILSEHFLLTEKIASYRFVLDRYLAANDKKIDPYLEIGNTEFIINLLKNNAGLSFLPEFSVKNEVTAGRLSILPIKDFHMRIWRQILYHKDKWITREMNAFIELAKQIS
ncbi:MAG: LysR family transcriptional regulator, partial [Lachnospiraceae bacterium]|nr:LysR family transcriptional regulator [Lachnospiraceae bacterium]